MHLEIVSPEATLFVGEVEAVTVPGALGEFQILNNHAPIISLLGKGPVKIKGNIAEDEKQMDLFRKDPSGKFVLDIRSGTLEFKDNRLIILAD